MTGRRVLAKRRKFERMCDVDDEGIFMAQSDTWHRLQEVQDEVDEAVMLYREDEGACLHGEARVW